MQLVIETDGTQEGTRIALNGRPQLSLLECEFAISTLRGKAGRPALHLVYGDPQGKPAQFTRYFGNDFAKYDEYFPMKEARDDERVASSAGR